MHQYIEQGMILQHYLSAKRTSTRFKTREALELWQQSQILKLLTKVNAQSTFYQQLWQGYDLSLWRTLPTIDKEIMMANFNNLNTANINKEDAFKLSLQAERNRDFTPKLGNITIGLSSGTSGHRGLFLVNEEERQRWAGNVLAKVLPRPLWQNHRIAFFLRANSNLYTSVGSRCIQFHFFDLLDSLETHLDRLNRLQPTLLVAPPSMLRLAGEALQAGRLSIQPQKVVSVADVLEPFEKEWLERSYRQPVHQVYQCTEGFLGVSCRFGILHLNEDLVAIQKDYLDSKRGIFTPIITDFSRFTQPIIRYKLNDVLTERQDTCPCGSVFMALDSIDGRCDDLLYFPATQHAGWIPVFPDFLRAAILQVDTPIQDYQVKQTAANILTIAIFGTLTNDAEHQIRDAIGRLCAQQRCIVPKIQFQPFEQLPVGVKKRRIQRTFALPKEVA